MENKEFTITLVTPYKPLFEGKVHSVVLPLYDGLAGILKGHVEMIAELGPGKVIIKTFEEDIKFFIVGGFLEVSKNKVTILANDAFKKEELNEKDVEQEYKEIQKQKAYNDEKIHEKLRKLDELRKKLSFLKEK